jgi:hypothetical protein
MKMAAVWGTGQYTLVGVEQGSNTSEKSVNFYQNTRRSTLEDCHLHKKWLCLLNCYQFYIDNKIGDLSDNLPGRTERRRNIRSRFAGWFIF